jgi:GT2 family glycosyltransferase
VPAGDASVSIVVVAYHSGDALLRCLDSLRAEPASEVLVIDNGGGGREIESAAALPGVEVVDPGGNIGFAAACNMGASRATGDVLLFLNPDAVVGAGALQALAQAVAVPDIGVAMPRLHLLDNPGTLNSGGNVLHVSGIAWAGGHGRPASTLTERREVAYATGAALAIRSELFQELGGFAPELFMYQEDLDLGWRARMRGLRAVVEPQADVYHDYDFARNPRKLYLLERNRLAFVLSAYSARLLLLAAPILVAAEVGMVALAVREGWLHDKVAGWRWLAENRRWVAERRRAIQEQRRVSDRALAPLLTAQIDPVQVSVPGIVRAANPLMRAYWSVVRRAL